MESEGSQELPLFSPVNILIAGIAIIVLIIVFIGSGSQIFSPGDLSSTHSTDGSSSEFSSHADFEQKCQLCHQSLTKQQADLCTDCHENEGNQIDQGSGIHGQMQNVSECRLCHPDHRGREFDMVAYARQTFDHASTGFILDERHAQASCQDCHSAESVTVSPDCETCHEEPAVHIGIFPTDCNACHQGAVWSDVTWNNQPYDHNVVGFSLNLHQIGYDQNPVECQDCHTTSTASSKNAGCQSCHSSHDGQFITEHSLAFGQTCTECHDGVDRMRGFDHSTIFPLDGKHTELACSSCHTGQEFNDSQTICASCHEEPQIHASYFGFRCQMCHTAEGWQPARLTVHDFPIDHGEPEDSTCVSCHISAYTEYTCYNCHEHEENKIQSLHESTGIEPENIPDCSTCHLDGLVHQES